MRPFNQSLPMPTRRAETESWPDPGPSAAALQLERFLPYRLSLIASLVSQALSQIYAERYGIGVPEWRVLATLGQYDSLTGKQIGTHSHMHKTKVSRAVALLERRKLVARRPNREDMREAFLSLTPAGRAIYDDLAPVALAFEQKLIAGIDGDELALLGRVLTKLTERAKQMAADASDRPG
jgi:DNA-binding MarR family transcriptional regulator